MAYHGPAEGKESLKQGVQRGYRVFQAVLTLQPPSIEPDVPVCKFIDQCQEPGNDSIQPVGGHFLLYE